MQKIATRDAYGKTLVKLGKKYDNIVVLDADLSKSTKTAVFKEEFPDRFVNVGIAEQNLACVAGGLALAGKVPFASSFAMFATGRAFEMIRNSICYPELNVKIAATHAGITVGEDGASHQANEDVAIMRAIPNMTVLVPADAVETEQIIEAAYHYHGPVYIRLGRSGVPVLYDESYTYKIGKASKLREGKDASIIAMGIMVSKALEAAEKLAEEGVQASVYNMSTIKPIDAAAIEEAAQSGCVVTAEEHNIIGGLGSAVAEVLGERCPVPLERVGIMDTFGESGKPDELLKKYGLTSEDIASAVIRALDRKTSCHKR
ncbi:transketolase family protein [Desulfitibacter alkalitolerans]|uniref:transketolase family protein n=1 Tax=Desulfitibacter alkalitolerans TaxID=264641 RepID=UPI0004838E8E|nr:transketolase family protein [Desulfitibacter alkalitolerans]